MSYSRMLSRRSTSAIIIISKGLCIVKVKCEIAVKFLFSPTAAQNQSDKQAYCEIQDDRHAGEKKHPAQLPKGLRQAGPQARKHSLRDQVQQLHEREIDRAQRQQRDEPDLHTPECADKVCALLCVDTVFQIQAEPHCHRDGEDLKNHPDRRGDRARGHKPAVEQQKQPAGAAAQRQAEQQRCARFRLCGRHMCVCACLCRRGLNVPQQPVGRDLKIFRERDHLIRVRLCLARLP